MIIIIIFQIKKNTIKGAGVRAVERGRRPAGGEDPRDRIEGKRRGGEA